MAAQKAGSFGELLAQAVAHLAETGYVSAECVETWIVRLRNAAERELGPSANIEAEIRRGMETTFKRLVDEGKVARYVPGVARFNLAIVRPALRSELDRRILAAADLIRLNRKEAIEATLRRLSGWATAIPPGGDATVNRREARVSIGKSIAQLSYEKRRVEIDQNYKLIANINAIVAEDAGAIAAVWHSHGEHDKSYNARKIHLARAEKVYAIRGNWALEQGLMNKGDGYTDEIDAPGTLVFCRCYYTYLTSPRSLPDTMLTRKGQEWIERSRIKAARMRSAA